MFNYEQSAMSSRAAVVALHSLAADNSPATTPDGIRTHVSIFWHPGRPPLLQSLPCSRNAVLRALQLRMLSVAYNNLAVGLFGMGLASDLPALQLLIDRAAATVRTTNFVSACMPRCAQD
jgi:hypothetical protein